MKIFSPAKINLFLHVLDKRADGYHDLRTLFERVSLCDEINLTPLRSGIVVEVAAGKGPHKNSIPEGPSNLAYRAAKLLKDRFQVSAGVRIRIQKNIPVGAGLGGGSSNAASVLLGLNRLWNLRLHREELLNLASGIGSDCAFFILETPFAEGSGRGEILKAIPAPRVKFWHVLVKPAFSISTPKAYQALDRLKRSVSEPRLTPKSIDAKMLLHSIREGDQMRLSEALSNSLELVLNKRLKEISKLKSSLVDFGALASLMSGSGSCVFGVFRSKRQALLAAKKFKAQRGQQVFVVSTY